MITLKEIRVTGLSMFRNLRIVPIEKNPAFFRIDEMVTDTEYISWNTTFSTPENALAHIADLARAKANSDREKD